jgi:hypothetical protein
MVVHAEVDPALKLDAGALKAIAPPPELSPKKQHHGKMPVKQLVMKDNETTISVKAGDTMETLLMRECGVKSDETAAAVGEVQRRNKILNIRRLFIGQKIIVSTMRCAAASPIKTATPPASPSRKVAAVTPQVVATKPLPLETPKMPNMPASKQNTTVQAAKADAAKPEKQSVDSSNITADKVPATVPKPASQSMDHIAALSRMWKSIVPAQQVTSKPLSFKSDLFSLTLDPARYPVFFAMDGSRILIDQKKSIPPRYIPLIAEQEPKLQIIAESTANGKRFLAALLRASRFYSVEENVKLEFGVDPKLAVRSDFKVEQSAESILNNGVLLLNDDKFPTSPALSAFLKKEGFALYEPFAAPLQPRQAPAKRIAQVTAKTQPEIVDAVLSALSLPLLREQHLELAPPDDSGINLSIKIERAVEHNGKRLVIICSGDPAVSAISEILEAGGENVVVLEAQDDFPMIVEKILASLGRQGTYGFHQLWPSDTASYSLQLSGVMIEEREPEMGRLLITDRPLDRFLKDIIEENGYNFYQKK